MHVLHPDPGRYVERDGREIHNALHPGANEGVGLSDASRLEDFGWSVSRIVNSYVWLGIACLGVLAGVYAWAVVRAFRERAAYSNR